jgi:nitrogen fixation/metabolism regulation signal transduction histidine kinase
MDYEPKVAGMSWPASLFALGIAVRAALLAGFAFAVIELLSTHRLYVTALLAAGIGALLTAELAHHIRRGDRMLERFVLGLAAGDFERPAPAAGEGFRRLWQAIDRATRTLDAAQARRQQQINYLQSLIDNVSAALFVSNKDGSVALANQAARRLAGQGAVRLEQLSSIGAHAAAALARLPPGERAVVRLASGQRVLAMSARFCAAGVSRRLLSLQNIEGELDAVELKAWQDVLRVLAHEIMNSLTPIASLAESVRPLVAELRSGQAGQRARADVADAIDAIARRSAGLSSFVGRYRKLAELPPPELRVVRVQDVIQRLDQLMSATLAEKGIEYISRVDPELIVHADRELLEQLLVNLLHNAIEASAGTDGPRIEVSCGYRDDDVAIRVADNGCGLPGKAAERIFVPLFTTKPGGSGIGLSLARQIASAHRGKLEAAANTPSGAVFTLLLPASGTPA